MTERRKRQSTLVPVILRALLDAPDGMSIFEMERYLEGRYHTGKNVVQNYLARMKKAEMVEANYRPCACCGHEITRHLITEKGKAALDAPPALCEYTNSFKEG